MSVLYLEMLSLKRKVSRVGNISPVSEYRFSISLALLYPDNLLKKEIQAQRTGRLIKVDILALKLVALHKELV